MVVNRRDLLLSLAATASGRLAQDATEPVITDEDGGVIPSFRLPVEISREFVRAPGALMTGGQSPDVILTEFFDFNCPYCRKAARELGALLHEDADLRLILLHNPILSQGSVEAAKVAMSVYSLNGAATGYGFYQKLLGARGAMTGERTLEMARENNFSIEDVSRLAQDPRIAAALSRHMDLAASAGLSGTPAFAIKGFGIVGYPGDSAIRKMIASVRSCDQLAC